ncbi:hypothetical protein AB0N06_22010 [Streptomyces sp. NPDC051020]|uniref:hypothetical protein n=1 Tax=Streptomyces sp. NPDC051020 TaxID=3155409 RepID=UPI00342F4E5D
MNRPGSGRMRPGKVGRRELLDHQLRFRLGGARHVAGVAVRGDRCADQVRKFPRAYVSSADRDPDIARGAAANPALPVDVMHGLLDRAEAAVGPRKAD